MVLHNRPDTTRYDRDTGGVRKYPHIADRAGISHYAAHGTYHTAQCVCYPAACSNKTNATDYYAGDSFYTHNTADHARSQAQHLADAK